MKKRIINWDIELLNSLQDYFYNEEQDKGGDVTKKQEVKGTIENTTTEEKKGGEKD